MLFVMEYHASYTGGNVVAVDYSIEQLAQRLNNDNDRGHYVITDDYQICVYKLCQRLNNASDAETVDGWTKYHDKAVVVTLAEKLVREEITDDADMRIRLFDAIATATNDTRDRKRFLDLARDLRATIPEGLYIVDVFMEVNGEPRIVSDTYHCA